MAGEKRRRLRDLTTSLGSEIVKARGSEPRVNLLSNVNIAKSAARGIDLESTSRFIIQKNMYQHYTRVCLKNSLIRNFGVFSAISASSILDLALLSLRIYSLN